MPPRKRGRPFSASSGDADKDRKREQARTRKQAQREREAQAANRQPVPNQIDQGLTVVERSILDGPPTTIPQLGLRIQGLTLQQDQTETASFHNTLQPVDEHDELYVPPDTVNHRLHQPNLPVVPAESYTIAPSTSVGPTIHSFFRTRPPANPFDTRSATPARLRIEAATPRLHSDDNDNFAIDYDTASAINDVVQDYDAGSWLRPTT
ncbi:MAG: hypothetical protein Q9198_009462, partial [Flavoplaca austrocitrina]